MQFELNMQFKQISFKGFNGRKEALQSIKRFAVCNPMFYRTDLLIHSYRVHWLVEALLPLAAGTFSELNPEKARTLALVHDDAEIITGDVQLYVKLKMTPKEQHQHEQNELEAIEQLSQRFPQMINGFNYQQLLLHALKKNCIEAQLVSLADKLDAFNESLHELHAGNKEFFYPVGLYTKLLHEFGIKFPMLQSLLKQNHQLLNIPQSVNREKVLEQGSFHTELSLTINSGIQPYECWKKITIEHGEKEVLLVKNE